MRRILVTGFKPFDGLAENSSGECAQRFDKLTIAYKLFTFTCHGIVLPVGPRCVQIVKEQCPDHDLIVMLGADQQSSNTLKLEATARNVSALNPNALAIIGGPSHLSSAIKFSALRELIQSHPQVEISHDAGAYWCNELYYQILYLRPEAIFIHIALDIELNQCMKLLEELIPKLYFAL